GTLAGVACPMAREAVCPKRGRVVAGGHPMRRIVVGSLVALASVVLAGRALADDLYATVEKTTAPGERALVRVRSDSGGPLTLVAYRAAPPDALLDAGIDLAHR